MNPFGNFFQSKEDRCGLCHKLTNKKSQPHGKSAAPMFIGGN